MQGYHITTSLGNIAQGTHESHLELCYVCIRKTAYIKHLILKFLRKAADNMAKKGQKSWSQPGFELGSFQTKKK